LQEYFDKTSAIGTSVGILKDGKITTYHYGEVKKGTAQIPNDNTLYEIGSVTKTFTALLLAQNIILKKAKLNGEINVFLPKEIPTLSFENKKITLEQLANHSSGLPRLPTNLLNSPNLQEENPYKNYSEKDLFDFLKNYQLEHKPNTNMNIQI
jgi:CubicO group peptidase (beta-lactamase class C family)